MPHTAQHLLVTGAWNPVTGQEPAALAARRDRLVRTVRAHASLGLFDRIVLTDATLTETDRSTLATLLPGVELPALHTDPRGPHDGPSYLEALLYDAIASAGIIAEDGARWVKTTGGYRIGNLPAILAVCDARDAAGLAFLHQHPLRGPLPQWALSAFYVLDAPVLQRLLTTVAAAADRARTFPLEGLLLEFFRTEGATRVRAPYPRLDAYFSTAGQHSGSPRMRLHQAAWRSLSVLGLYALALPASTRRPPGDR